MPIRAGANTPNLRERGAQIATKGKDTTQGLMYLPGAGNPMNPEQQQQVTRRAMPTSAAHPIQTMRMSKNKGSSRLRRDTTATACNDTPKRERIMS